MGLFNETVIPEENKIATKELLKRGTETPSVATQKIATASQLEQTTQKMASEFVSSDPSQARAEALQGAQAFAKGTDLSKNESLQAIFERISGEGDRSTRSLARSLKITGNDPGSSSKGRDIIGRSVTDVQGRLMEAAASFLEAQEQRKFAAIPMIDNIAQAQTNEKLTKLGVGERAGAQVRQLQQMVNDADFNRQMQELELRYRLQPALLNSVIAARPAEVEEGWLGSKSEFTQKVIQGAALAATGGMSGAAGTSVAASTSGMSGMAGMAGMTKVVG